MKLYFDNIFGHQTDGDLLFSVVSAEFDKNEWNYAFENGWSPIMTVTPVPIVLSSAWPT